MVDDEGNSSPSAGDISARLLELVTLLSNEHPERVFKYLTVALVAYVIDAALVNPPVTETLRATIVPTISADHQYIAALVAILGTTISPSNTNCCGPAPRAPPT